MAQPTSNIQGPKVMLYDGVDVLGSSANPIINDSAGIGVQPVAFVSPQHVIVDSGGGGGGANAAAGLTGSPVPASAGYTGYNSNGNLVGVSVTNRLPVDSTGTLAVSNFPVSFSISNFPATQPVSGTVAVSNFPATQPVSGAVSVSNFPATQAVSGVVALSAGAAVIGHVIVDSAPTTPVTIASLPSLVAGSAVIGHVIVDSAPTTPVTLAVLPSLVAGSAVIGHVVVDSAPSTAVTNAGVFATQSTLSAETTKVIGTVNVSAGQTVSVTQSTPANLTATVTQQTLTKGTQGATGVTVQELKDAGRNNSTLFTILPVVTTASEALLSLTGFKSDVVVTATTTPAVVTAGKKYRITSIACTYVAIATAGSSRLSIRKTLGGVVTVTAPVLWQTIIGAPAATAGISQTVEYAVDIEINAGDGIGVSQLGLGATQTAAVVGFGAITISGYEY